MSCARETTPTVFLMKLSPLKPKSCAGHNSHNVSDNLVIFGRDEEEDQSCARRTTLTLFII